MAFAASQPITLVAQYQTPPIPTLGLRQVADGGDVLMVGSTQVEGRRGGTGAVADLLVQAQCLFVRRDARLLLTFPLELA
jgi:hypothetical protein